MNEQYVASVLTILAFSILFINPLTVVEPQSMQYSHTASNEMISSNLNIAATSDPIVINSNTDFEDQGWSGNGTESYPYLIEDLEILITEADSVCIQISDTSSHFEIRNSIFTSQNLGIGINLLEVSNGSIVNCTFENLVYGIYSQSTNSSSFIDCTFRYCSTALALMNVKHSTFSENTILFNGNGLFLSDTSECNITDNLIAYNTSDGLFLQEDSSQNCIFNNSIAYNQNEWDRRNDLGENNAIDHGFNNQWDDNISLGNSWSDYSGSGAYNISGGANSIDRFPRLAHFDLIGPDIFGVTNWEVTVMPGPCPFSDLTIHATVRDESGVDSVLIYYGASSNGTRNIVEMTHTSSDQNPDLYTFYIEGPFYNFDFIRYYYIWANDTIGHNSTSAILRNTNQCSSECYFCPAGIIGITILASGILILIAVLLKKRMQVS